jgi:hypothetical protein
MLRAYCREQVLGIYTLIAGWLPQGSLPDIDAA